MRYDHLHIHYHIPMYIRKLGYDYIHMHDHIHILARLTVVDFGGMQQLTGLLQMLQRRSLREKRHFAH